MTSNDETGEDELLHSVALQNANAILLARQRGERELVQAKERADQLALELKSALRRAMLGADVAKAMTGIEPLSESLQNCAAAVVRHLDAAFARIWTVNADGTTLELRASAGLYTHLDGPHGRVPIGSFKIGRIARGKQAHLSNDVQHDPQVGDRAWAAREGLTAFAGYPLLVQDRLIGVMAMFSRSALAMDTLDTLASVADIVALGIERRLTETLRAETELRKASILEAALDGIIAIDGEGHITDFNPAAERLFQRKREDVLGQEMAALIIPPAYRERHRKGLARYVATGEGGVIGKRIELSAVRADGSEFPVELAITAIALKGGVGFTGYLRDITERRQAEADRAELLAREQMARSSLATTLRSIGDAVIATDTAAGVTFMNPVAEALTGWSLQEAMGKPLRTVFRIVNERSLQEIESPADKVLRDGVGVDLANHTVLLTREGHDGMGIPIEDRAAPIRDDQGVLTGVVLVFRDVSAKKADTDRKDFLTEATPALTAALDVRKTLTALAQLAVPRLADWCAVDVLAEDGRATERIVVAHVDPQKVILAEEIRRKFPPSPDAPAGVPNVIRTGQSEFYVEVPDALLTRFAVDADHLRILRELRLKSAMIVPLKARARVLGAITLVFAESGRTYTNDDLLFAEELARRAGIAVDNARLYESEQNARRNADIANRAKDEFLATVSHELRTPLNSMLGWTRLLRSGDLTTPQAERALETIERNAVTQAQLIEDLLDVSRIISGKLRLDVQSVKLVHIVQHAVDALRLASEAKVVTILATLDENAEPIMGDPHRLQQVVWNLLSNAIKFTPKGGRIQLIMERTESNLKLVVVDTGRGIAPAFLAHVFERFKQADGATTRAFGGLGLGLAISRHIVELHGGTIEVESKGEGLGSTFTVLLPVSPIRPDSRASAARLSPSPTEPFEIREELKDLKVLVVDDEEDARDLLVAVLEKCGAIVAFAGSAAEAMEKFLLDRPDVLISDIGMPGEDGYELIRKVRALDHAAGANIPAAALTAYARAEDRRKALDAGFMMHLPKPVEPAELVAVVANLTRFAVRR